MDHILKKGRQWVYVNNVLELSVNRTPIFIRSIMYLVTLLSFLLPILGVIWNFVSKEEMHFGYFISLFSFGLLGFYLLRVSLWNTYGKEIIVFNENRINYVADYGWFKDSKKDVTRENPMHFFYCAIGYEEEQKGVLIIGEKHPIVCVTKMDKKDIELLIDKLEASEQTSVCS